eukprot:Gb_36029 [translate_table: standard]
MEIYNDMEMSYNDVGSNSDKLLDEKTQRLQMNILARVEKVVLRKLQEKETKVDCVIFGEENSLNVKEILGHLVRFVLGSIVKPLQALHQFLGPKKAILEEALHHSPRKC